MKLLIEINPIIDLVALSIVGKDTNEALQDHNVFEAHETQMESKQVGNDCAQTTIKSSTIL